MVLLNNKRAVFPLIGVLIIAGLSAMIYSGVMMTGGLDSYSEVYKQNYGTIECVQENDYDIVIKRYADDVSTSKCDHYTNECYFHIENKKESWSFTLGSASLSYDVCGIDGLSGCSSYSYTLQQGQAKDFTIPYGKEVKFKSGGFGVDDRKYLEYTKKAKSFYIRGQENGRVYRQESCILNSDLKKRVLADGLNELQKTGVNSHQNYMIDFVKVASKTYTYQGQEVICQARELYSVDNEQFKDGSVRKIQGNKVTSVECCPAEANCDKDTFEFVKENMRECSYDFECANGGNPIADSGTSYIKSTCQQGTCINSAPIRVDCTNNAICISKYGENSVCDLSPANFGQCKENTKMTGYCGDGVCESMLGETTTSCPNDCGWPVKESWDWWVWALIIIGSLVGLKLGWPYLATFLQTARMFLKTIPGIGILIP
ncbi:MAG: hypothetical protein OEL87_00010 [Nanoarchaeota archaeon]|nr:hypothetical protein [Nanoarchaeota archaeon]